MTRLDLYFRKIIAGDTSGGRGAARESSQGATAESQAEKTGSEDGAASRYKKYYGSGIKKIFVSD